jgi:hypothetical protein
VVRTALNEDIPGQVERFLLDPSLAGLQGMMAHQIVRKRLVHHEARQPKWMAKLQ